LNGFSDKPPALPPLATADMVAGLYGAFGVLAALRDVERNGGAGQVIDLSLFESIFSLVASEAVKHKATGAVGIRNGNQAVNTAPRNVYLTADGKYLALSGSMQSMFERLARAIGLPDLIDNPMFATNDRRVRNCEALNVILQDYFGGRTLDENLAAMESAGVTVAPVLSMAELIDHPFVRGRGVLEDVEDRDLGSLPLHAPVPRLSGTPAGLRRPAPELGEHTEEILRFLEDARA
jgi:crotonobetainyl-CoA:carnitine CoA-transferase CaiB-like acyl-CoA transferase